ncbi:glycosyltransferase family 2 protein [Pseudorhodoferax sp. Leaf265]|uniref:glycosyltransferase family 2 protein n=1 Tax=Pseudorhodoferax sp. Leaf265 TaxID=1736315 RepID=UPI0006FBCFE5|nr:glycosyltransferase family 2 protein [Pseudorhodoferax sp. Leaf265]KQP17269.1 bactoprenol glucosyl transferase [Pseudorhodoferax sp. Leaf265]
MPAIERGGALTLSLVVPVFNEAQNLAPFLHRVTQVLGEDARIDAEIIFVNDGSDDDTVARLLMLRTHDARIKVVDLSRNFGKEAALSAGLNLAVGRVVVPIDVDLQDPPELIPRMVELWRAGHDVVVARRIDRNSDPLWKRKTAQWFYAVHNRLSHPKIPENVGDFRLMDRSVVEVVNQLPETHRFMKGIFAWVGFDAAHVDYERPRRAAGHTKFNIWQLWSLALEALTSFGNAPLRAWTYIGVAVSMASLAFATFIVARVLVTGVDVPGYASLIVATTFLGGVQMLGIGLIGEYVSRSYIETKKRPVYVVKRIFGIGAQGGP